MDCFAYKMSNSTLINKCDPRINDVDNSFVNKYEPICDNNEFGN